MVALRDRAAKAILVRFGEIPPSNTLLSEQLTSSLCCKRTHPRAGFSNNHSLSVLVWTVDFTQAHRPMEFFIYNTDARSLSEPPLPRFPVLISRQFAALGGDRKKFGRQFEQLEKDDILLMYENSRGIVAIGSVITKWDGKSHVDPWYYDPKEMGHLTGGAYEYRIPVRWFADISNRPISLQSFRDHTGSTQFTPRGAIRRIAKHRDAVTQMVAPFLSQSFPMNINCFFTDTLGAQLKNARWSWGAVDPLNHRVFLRIWQDGFRISNGKEHFHIARNVPRRPSNGFKERHEHVALIRNGAEGYGVVCVAVDPDTTEARKIKSFDNQFLVQFGEITSEGGDTFAEVIARVSVADLARTKTAESTLADDLQAIVRQKLEATTKTALINARIGQGLFRQQVLRIWENACAVSGSSVSDAIRASHIKPWRSADNDERLDAFNGLPLTASFDALFDAGLIAFDEHGRLLISSRLNETERSIFGLTGKCLRKLPPKESAAYLEYHRQKIFRQ